MRLRRSFLLVTLLLCAPAMFQTVRAQGSPPAGFDEYVNKALRDWEAPGLAIAVVQDDRVVFAKGYGVRKLGDPTPVNEKTLFAIGSAGKAFTAAAVAMLLDEGKLKWDDPVTKYLPDFEMYDPYVTRELTVRDLLTHRSGIDRGDLLWYGSENSRDEILRRVRFIKPASSLRSVFGYQNLMYLAAGQVAARVSGKSWDEFIRQRIFAPLGMASSNTSITDLKHTDEAANVATPHAKVAGKVVAIPWRNIDNIAPAGAINSNVVDMAQWVRLQLGEGAYQNARLISSGAAKELHTPQTIIRAEPPLSLLYPEAHFMAYGLGWFLSDYRGRKVVEHGGAIDGMRAQVGVIPEEKLGVVILTNLNGTPLPHALMFKVFDAYLAHSSGSQRDWSAELLKVIKPLEEKAKEAEKKVEADRVKGTRASLAPEKYAGTYQNDLYGEVSVTEGEGKLMLRFGPAFTGDLEHWHYDTFRARWRGPILPPVFVSFALNAQGKVEELKLDLPDLAAYPFKRSPEKAAAAAIALSEAELKRFAGKYELKTPPIEVSVEMVGGKLKLVVPGQPVYTLAAVSANKSQIEGAPAGFFVQFEMAGDKVSSLMLAQGGLSFTLLPKP